MTAGFPEPCQCLAPAVLPAGPAWSDLRRFFQPGTAISHARLTNDLNPHPHTCAGEDAACAVLPASLPAPHQPGASPSTTSQDNSSVKSSDTWAGCRASSPLHTPHRSTELIQLQARTSLQHAHTGAAARFPTPCVPIKLRAMFHWKNPDGATGIKPLQFLVGLLS